MENLIWALIKGYWFGPVQPDYVKQVSLHLYLYLFHFHLSQLLHSLKYFLAETFVGGFEFTATRSFASVMAEQCLISFYIFDLF